MQHQNSNTRQQDSQHQPPTPGCVAAVLPAGGSGQRFGASRNKLFALLSGKPIWYWSALRLRQHPLVGRIVMAVSDQDRSILQNDFADLIDELKIELVAGGKERTDSVRIGLDSLVGDDAVRYIAVHDAARPLVSAADLDAVFTSAVRNQAAILATPIPGSVKRGNSEKSDSADGGDGELTAATVDRRDLWIALTPQVFAVSLLVQAYEKLRGRPATDDAELVERIGQRVSLVRGSAENIKITYPDDLTIAQAILKRQSDDA